MTRRRKRTRVAREPMFALGDTVAVAKGYSHFGGSHGVIVEHVKGFDVTCTTYLVKLTEGSGGYYRVPEGKLSRVGAS